MISNKTFAINIISLFILNILNAQTSDVDWMRKAGSNGYDDGWAIASAIDKVFVVGRFENTASFSGTTITSNGDYDGFLAAYSLSGDMLWVKKLGGTASDYCRTIAIGQNNNIYVAGNFEGTISIGDTTLTSTNGWDVFIASYDENGNFLWARNAGGQGDQWPTSITVGRNGKVFLTGIFYNNLILDSDTAFSAGSADVFMLTYNSEGGLISSSTFGGSGYDTGNSIETDSSDYVYITGGFEQTFFAGNDSLVSNGSSDAFLLKSDQNGNVIRLVQFGGVGTDAGYGVSCHGNDVIFTGAFKETVYFSDSTFTSKGNSDVFLIKLDASGNYIWSRNFGGSAEDRGHSVAVSITGEIYAGGYFSSLVAFPDKEVASEGFWDVFVSKIENNGNYVWTITGGGEGYDICRSLDVLDSSVFITGYFSGNAAFGDTSLTSISSTYDIYFGRIVEGPNASMLSIVNNQELFIYPNPASGNIKVESNNMDFDKVFIRSLTGQILISKEITSMKSGIEISLEELTSGVYLLELTGNEINVFRKLIVR